MSNKVKALHTKEIIRALHSKFEDELMDYADILGVDKNTLPKDVYEKPYMVTVRMAIHDAVIGLGKEFGETK